MLLTMFPQQKQAEQNNMRVRSIVQVNKGISMATGQGLVRRRVRNSVKYADEHTSPKCSRNNSRGNAMERIGTATDRDID